MRVMSLFIIGVFLCSGVIASSGVSPGGYEIDFEPGLSKTFEFWFSFDDYVKAETYVDGALAEYVTLDKEFIEGRGSVVATLNLPAEIKTPGENLIRIGAHQLAGDDGGIEIVYDMGGVIKVNVPYPGKYLELEVIASDYNYGDLMNISLKAYNRGKVSLDVSPMIQIFKDDQKVKTLNNTPKKTIAPFKDDMFYFTWNTSDYLPGEYIATALADYGVEDLARDDDPFRLGELKVTIVNHSRIFQRDKIDRFDIEVESFWNSPISELYAVVFILDQEFVTFRTPSIPLSPWKKDMLKGFLDTTTVEEGTFLANITLYYEGKTTSQIVTLKLNEQKDYTPYIIGIVLLIILGVMAWRVKLFVRRVKEHRR